MDRDEELDGHLRQVWGPVGHPLPNGNLENLYAESGRTLQGSFSAVSKPNLQVNTRWKALAKIYAMHSFAPFSTLILLNC